MARVINLMTGNPASRGRHDRTESAKVRRLQLAHDSIRAPVLFLGTVGIVPGMLRDARADEIVIRGGGRIQGKMVDDPKQPGRVLVWLTQGRHPLSFTKAQVLEVIPHPSVLDDYVTRRAKVASTAAAQVELGTWCSQNKLEDLAHVHFETALQFDPASEPAHQKLGHVLHNGAWRTQDELNAMNGMVKHNGRWITAEAKSKREAHSQLTAAETSWLRRIRIMHQALVSGANDRRREAESQLMAIREPEAIRPLVRVFGSDDRSRRLILALVLGVIPGQESSMALIRQVLSDPDAELRAAFFDQLKNRDRLFAIAQFVRALGSSDIRVINRAAWALGNLDAVETVPKLVNVLVTTRSEVVVDTFDDLDVRGSGPNYPLPVLGLTKSGIAAYLTPPAVGPGAVAYGATVGPFFPYAENPVNGPGLTMGTGTGVLSNSVPDPRLATYSSQNLEVLTALQKLTRQDFGFDIDAWRVWVNRSFNANARPARRVVQP